MALTITNITTCAGGEHLKLTVNHEGVTRQWDVSRNEVDTFFDDLSQAEQVKMLIMLWAKYRRSQSRAIQNVGIA